MKAICADISRLMAEEAATGRRYLEASRAMAPEASELWQIWTTAQTQFWAARRAAADAFTQAHGWELARMAFYPRDIATRTASLEGRYGSRLVFWPVSSGHEFFLANGKPAAVVLHIDRAEWNYLWREMCEALVAQHGLDMQMLDSWHDPERCVAAFFTPRRELAP
jgi:hypothetical protein